MVGAPRFELGRPQGSTILQTAAAMPFLASSSLDRRFSKSLPYLYDASELALGRRVERRAMGLEAICSPRSPRNSAESERIEPSRFPAVALFSRQFLDHSR